MKILLSWLVDYLDCSLAEINVDSLVHLFNTRTAEIESFERVVCQPEKMFLAQVVSIEKTKITCICPQLGKTAELPFRSDAIVGQMFMVFQEHASLRWMSMSEFCNERDGLIPAVYVSQKDAADGSWRDKIAPVDYVLDVDNKSINHRPDLWGHYGIAREVAAFLHIKLKPLSDVLANRPIIHSNDLKNSLSVLIRDAACTRFAALESNNISQKDCPVLIMIRLLSLGAKPVGGVVDLTNYVMFDTGHPMHVFDAKDFANKEILIRKAKKGEMLHLLDGQMLKLTEQDLVVANNQSPVSLAGIMGGKDSGLSGSTKNIILEAAGFDPLTIRKSAQHFKLRTEASIRFEKHLDPMQNIVSIQRFLYLAQQSEMLKPSSDPIVSVGAVYEPIICEISHEFIQARIGMPMTKDFIVKTLSSLGFCVEMEGFSYRVTVPTYRTTKDVGIQEDILEEIVRSYGFENVDQQLPSRSIAPFSLNAVDNISKVKNHLAYGMAMHEVRDYLLYDQSFVQRLKVDISSAVKVRNPLSENWTTLVTSLVPHLLKGVECNAAHSDHIRLFEYNRTWSKSDDLSSPSVINEKKSLSGIIFDKKDVDFYVVKQELQGLWDLCKIDVVWEKPDGIIPAWYDQHKVARLLVGDQCIGFAGMMSGKWMHEIISGSAFVFELDGELLELATFNSQQFKPWSKYQDVSYDMSLLIPLKVTVDRLKKDIIAAHELILSVELVDFFEKDQWPDHRSVTFRYTMSNREKTMTKKDLDEIVESVTKAVKKHDAQIR
ncbi:MAG: phenylalanine--tRNA ligase subunit beta [Candidatus Dependentiae bacterium]|nr:phenylalanine--tRNA ligase subunit beta [Candidatus Dependentiae bacterium]